jgi:hypothetical protein
MGNMLMNPKFKDYLSDEWKGVYDSIRGGYAGLSGDATGLAEAVRKYDACADMMIAAEKNTCEAMAVKAVLRNGVFLNSRRIEFRQVDAHGEGDST